MNFYVDPVNGNDSNAGSLTSPWKTIFHAFKNSSAGDTVQLRAGTYSEPWIEGRGDPGNKFGHIDGGAPGSWWTLQAYPGEVPILNTQIAAYSMQWCVFRGLTFHVLAGGGQSPLDCSPQNWFSPPGARGTHMNVVNCTFTGPQPRYGYINFEVLDGLIDSNAFICTGGGSTTDHGVYLHYSSFPGVVIRNNEFEGISGFSVHVYSEDPGFQIKHVRIDGNVFKKSQLKSGVIISHGDPSVVIDDILICNNIFDENPESGVIVVQYATGSPNNVRIDDNTFYNNGEAIILGDEQLSNSIIENNLIFQASGNHIDYQGSGSVGVSVRNNLYWGGTNTPRLVGVTDSSPVVGNPKLSNPPTDFHILAGSAAWQKAFPLADVPTDKDGVFRIKPFGAPDIGAYQYVSVAAPPLPPPPTPPLPPPPTPTTTAIQVTGVNVSISINGKVVL